MSDTARPPRLLPTGTCWCGCDRDVGLGKFFAPGHDKTAESALIAVHYGATVPRFLDAHGYGPNHSVTAKAIKEAGWTECTRCGYRGAPASMRNHEKNHAKADGQ